jgi:hypothetical protein
MSTRKCANGTILGPDKTRISDIIAHVRGNITFPNGPSRFQSVTSAPFV